MKTDNLNNALNHQRGFIDVSVFIPKSIRELSSRISLLMQEKLDKIFFATGHEYEGKNIGTMLLRGKEFNIDEWFNSKMKNFDSKELRLNPDNYMVWIVMDNAETQKIPKNLEDYFERPFFQELQSKYIGFRYKKWLQDNLTDLQLRTAFGLDK